MAETVIIAGARTPIGKLSGAFSSLTAAELGGFAIAEALSRAGLSPDLVDYVLMGQVIQAGSGQMSSRQAAANGGIPLSATAVGINKACPSGLVALYQADLMIKNGDADIVVAGGMESMTNAPHLASGLRAGIKLGDTSLVDSVMHDGLTCGLEHVAMGASTEQYNQKDTKFSRQRQDEFSARSHQLAAAATAAGRLAEEIVPVVVKGRKGDTVVEVDEGIRSDTTVESLGSLRPAFSKDADATVTAGNASQISDAGSAVIMMSKDKARSLGLEWLGELIGYGQVAGPDTSLLHQPSNAIMKACSKIGLDPTSADVYEINEAFAAVGLASMDDLGLDETKVNPNGGAIALGHPIGMSGNRIALATLYELRRRGGGIGIAALCGGGGQGDAAILKVG
jgi:acetyl-CoA C-acetyltransferase